MPRRRRSSGALICHNSPVVDDVAFDVLLFDLGGVLVEFSGFDELTRLVPGAPDREEIRNRWIACDTVRRFERGEIATQRFADGVIRELDLDLSPADFIASFVSWARGPFVGAEALLRHLRADHVVACLSNSNELHTPRHRKDVAGLVDRCYFSDEIGAVKPDREVFEYVIADLATPPSRIAFFDDTAVNVEAALRAGLTAFEVDGFGALKKQLHRLELLDP